MYMVFFGCRSSVHVHDLLFVLNSGILLLPTYKMNNVNILIILYVDRNFFVHVGAEVSIKESRFMELSYQIDFIFFKNIYIKQ